ncbi:baculoviral IAP repeat-containing protein 5 [Phymastichus coffea]|uniref:baculoviral IAP repeat-containing protein 5 n=1 Tax=Phymastichus coffea TaxID=108790 RepID=UPI00273B4A49|nr:baculoviral IAP repeat-containing protein 5 [Phymastichus coffea]
MTQKTESLNLMENLSPTFWKKGRLQTFKHWPFKSDEHCNPESMAAAGFYAVGGEDEPDLAECFMCSKQLDGWEPEDDPWQEHKKHQPNCPFVEINKTDESQLTVKELFHLMEKHYKRKMTGDFEKCIEEMKKEWKANADTIPGIYESAKKSKKSLD